MNENLSENLLPGSNKIHKEKEYWLNKLAGELVKSSFPYDDLERGISLHKRNKLSVGLPDDLFKKLDKLTNQSDYNLYIVLLAALTVLLNKYTAHTDILVAAPIYRQDIEGRFINTVLIIRNQLRQQNTFKELILQVKRTVFEANENSNYPVERLMYQLDIPGSETGDSLLETAILLENIQEKKYIDHLKTNILFSFLKHEGGLLGEVGYNPSLYRERTVEKIIVHFKHLLQEAVNNVNCPINELEVMSKEEREKILLDFNKTTAEYPAEKTISQLFEEQVSRTPDKIAIFDSLHHCSISYQELNSKSNGLARVLKKKGVEANTIAAIMMRPSLEMLAGVIAVLKAGGVYLPLEMDLPEKRIRYMLNDSQARLLLTGSDSIDSLEVDCEKMNIEEDVWLQEMSRAGTNLQNTNTCDDLIYIIYTSGTTGRPKGVLIKNKNLVNYVSWFAESAQLKGSDKTILLSSFAFDLGYTSVYPSILNGCELHILARENYLDADFFLKYIRKNRISYIKISPSLFAVIINGESFSKEMFRSLRLVVMGGEKINLKDVDKVFAANKDIRVMNHYGPTETTIGSVYFVDFEKYDVYGRRSVIGRPIYNSQVFILDKDLRLLPIETTGELCIGGDGVGRGYMNNPELTTEKFIRDVNSHSSLVISSSKKLSPNDQCPMTNDLLYKTGDLARWLADGNIEFLGRVDHQVKIRGFRVELGEIENLLVSHKLIKEAAVVANENEEGEVTIVAYCVSDFIGFTADSNEGDSLNTILEEEKHKYSAELKGYLANEFPPYMIPTLFMFIDRIPLTPNGKLNRKKLPRPSYDKEAARRQLPRDEIEKHLVEIWEDILEVKPGSIGIEANFFELGGHSLKAVMLISKIEKELDVKIPLRELFSIQTIVGLSGFIKGAKGAIEKTFAAIQPAEKKEFYALSSAQKRLYVLQQMLSSSTAYNVYSAFELEGEPDRGKLEETFAALITRHESLRTSFELVEGESVQRVYENVDFSLEYHDACQIANSPSKIENSLKKFVRSFDLSHAPLLRVGLVKIGSSRYQFLVDMHHIITDGISHNVLIGNFITIYKNEESELARLKLQYKDYSQWQQSQMEREVLKKQEDFWLKEFAEQIPILHLPTDYKRPVIQSFAGNVIGFELDETETRALNEMAQQGGGTLFMVLLALYNVFLARISNQEDIIIGVPTAGRRHADLEKIIGMFVNTLAMRNYPSGEETFTTFSRQVIERALLVFENQDYQFEELLEKVPVERDLSRNPLFDVMFVFQNILGTMGELTEEDMGGVKIKAYPYENKTAKFDLSLSASEVGEKLYFIFEYCTSLFREETIRRFIIYFKQVITRVIENPEQKLSQIEIITEEEKRQILVDFNDTEAEYPRDKTIHYLFEEQVERSPHRVALLGTSLETRRGATARSMHLTYHELNERCSQVANRLRTKDIKPDSTVGIIVDRSFEMVIGILGILKAGGAYLPIDPGYPQERKAYILRDSSAKVLLTSRGVFKEGRKSGRAEARKNTIYEVETIFLDDCWDASTCSSDTSDQERRGEPCVRPSLHSPDVDPSNTAGFPSPGGVPRSPMKPAGRGGLELAKEQSAKSKEQSESFQEIRCTPCALRSASSSRNLAYVIYTSGSTGTPKGVLIEHKSVVNILTALDREYPFREPDTYLLKTSFVFDVSVTELFCWFLGGGRLAILEENGEKEINKLLDSIESTCITHINFVPSMFSVLVSQLNSRNINKLSGLKYIFLAGEALLPGLVNKFRSFNTEIALENLYGPTETTIYSSKYSLSHWDGLGNIPIGKPLQNTRIYILDRVDNLQPLGVPGELCISGVGLARGYLKREELNSEKFIENPFLRGDRLYRTGDLTRWLPDGNIEFLGRIDHQVKIRGFRIEPQEIENQLLNHKEVKEAVVLERKNKAGEKYLCAYVVPRGKGETNGQELRKYLAQKLPVYMIPSFFVICDRIPLTPSGKIDRKALPEPEIKAGKEYKAPDNEVEEKLVEIWSEALGIEKGKISTDANFFELGGHSLNATMAVAKIHKEFNLIVPLEEMFKTPTITGVASLINVIEWTGNPKVNADRKNKEIVL